MGIKNTKLSNITVEQANTYLRSRGIPRNWIRAIFDAFVDKALQESDWMKADRIYTLVGLALHRSLGFGYKRIIRVLREMSNILNDIEVQDDLYWDKLMDELYENTGMVIHSADEGHERVSIEYRCPNGEREMTEEELEKYEMLTSAMEEDAKKHRKED